MNTTIELLVMKLRSEIEEMYLSKEFKEDFIQEGVKVLLGKNLQENKISSTEYKEALNILKRYKLRNT